MVITDSNWYCLKVHSHKGDNFGNTLDNVECSQFNPQRMADLYKCEANRAFREDQDKYSYLEDSTTEHETSNCSGYMKQEIIENEDINPYRDLLSIEIDRRRQHVWYRDSLSSLPYQINNYKTSRGDISSYNMTRQPLYVEEGETIDAPQRNLLKEISYRIRARILELQDLHDLEGPAFTDISSGTEVTTESLSSFGHQLFQLVAKECICYADCIEFQLYYNPPPPPCNCQGYYSCGCNYR